MSKTSKIRKLKKQLIAKQKEIDFQAWQIKQRLRDTAINPVKFRMEPPPVFYSNNRFEEDELNRMVRYVYRQMEKEYQMACDLDPYCKIDNINFTLYLGREIYYRLLRVTGYHDFEDNLDGTRKFRGHDVVLVDENMHCRFVRVR